MKHANVNIKYILQKKENEENEPHSTSYGFTAS